jgi:hypothetical protein
LCHRERGEKRDVERRTLPVERTNMEQQGGDKQQGEEVLRCKKTIKKRSSYKIKEATGGEVRKMIMERDDMRRVKQAKGEGKKMVKKGIMKSIDSYFK